MSIIDSNSILDDLIREGDSNESIFEKVHFNPELKSLFSPYSRAKFDELVQSVRKYGVLVPIVVNPQAEVIDGHTRFSACLVLKERGQLSSFPQFKIVRLPDKLAEKRFVYEANRTREENRFQKIESSIGLVELEMQEAAARQKAGRKKSSEQTLAPFGAKVFTGKTSEVIARRIGIKTRTVERALFLVQNADDEMKSLLRDGTLSISGACRRLGQGKSTYPPSTASKAPELSSSIAPSSSQTGASSKVGAGKSTISITLRIPPKQSDRLVAGVFCLILAFMLDRETVIAIPEKTRWKPEDAGDSLQYVSA